MRIFILKLCINWEIYICNRNLGYAGINEWPQNALNYVLYRLLTDGWDLLSLYSVGVSKVVTVDIKGNWQRWLKVRDLTKGVTYGFRVQAKTISYGPELEANITAGPVEGESHRVCCRPRHCICCTGRICPVRFMDCHDPAQHIRDSQQKSTSSNMDR